MPRPSTYSERFARAFFDLIVTAVAMGAVLAAVITWAAIHAPGRLPS